MFSVRTKTESRRFQIPPIPRALSLKKVRFRDGLVWTVGLTVEIKAAFSNFCGEVWTLIEMSKTVHFKLPAKLSEKKPENPNKKRIRAGPLCVQLVEGFGHWKWLANVNERKKKKTVCQ